MWDNRRTAQQSEEQTQALIRRVFDGPADLPHAPDAAIDLSHSPHQIGIDIAPPPQQAGSGQRESSARSAASGVERSVERLLKNGNSGTERGLRSWTYSFLKRATDIVVSSLLLIALSPLLVIAAAAVRATSRGPALFRHQRTGRNDAAITILKFRTMVDGADRLAPQMEELARNGQVDAVDGPVFKAPDDPRITAVGRVLRRTNVDELPQLFNVLAGDMSLVGPRPLVAKEIAALSPHALELRHRVRPGITGLWQVVRTEETSFDERIELDLLYVGRRSMRLDMTLLALTPWAILRGNRSY